MNKVLKKKQDKVSRVMQDTFIFPKFALQIHKLISSKYEDTYIVGGAVRNLILKKKVTDVDIATCATPAQIVNLLSNSKILFTDKHKKMGVVIAEKGTDKIEITTFRKEVYSTSRFPKVSFIRSPKIDSNRRDFTINALYYNPVSKKLLDFHKGLRDLQLKQLKFIGNATRRIKEDPLRVIRAYRFQLQYKLKIDAATERALKHKKTLLKTISATRVQKEINAIKNISLRKTLQKVIHSNT